jgi:hypothetical protein
LFYSNYEAISYLVAQWLSLQPQVDTSVGWQQKLGFLSHLLSPALKFVSLLLETGRLNIEKLSFLIHHDLVQSYHSWYTMEEIRKFFPGVGV